MGTLKSSRRFSFLMVLAFFSAFSSCQAEEIWFAPPDSVPRGGEIASDDFMSLFEKPSLWEFALSHINIFAIDQAVPLAASDGSLRLIFAFLRQHNIALAITSIQTLEGASCGQGVEGFGQPGQSSALLNRLQGLGAEVSYFGLDSPLTFGHIYSGKNACRMAVADVAREVSHVIHGLKKAYPKAKIIDAEAPTAVTQMEWVGLLQNWLSSYKVAVGAPLDGIAFDVNWHLPWEAWVRSSVDILHSEAVSAGMLIESDGGPFVTDRSWMDATTLNILRVQDAKLKFDFLWFATWMRHPVHNLPERNHDTFAHLIDLYTDAMRKNAN